ncbi:MAG: DUF427 domain-containing protein [Pseudomonadota bacterium]
MISKSITIARAEGTWVVRIAGAVIGESTAALVLHEDNLEDVIYFPREDVEMAFLDQSDLRTTCPAKGEAQYYTVVAKSGPVVNAAWSYETPIEDVSRIAGHIAFHANDMVAVEQI